TTTPLSPGHTYKWYVGSVSVDGLATFWNSGTVFSITPLAAPTAIGPSGPTPANADTPTFTWNQVANADHYDVWVNEVNPANTNQVLVSQVLRNTNVVQSGSPSWTASSALTPGHTYKWFVGSVSTNGTTVWNAGTVFSINALTAPV